MKKFGNEKKFKHLKKNERKFKKKFKKFKHEALLMSWDEKIL